MTSDENQVGESRVALVEALEALRHADELTDARLTDGLRDSLGLFAEWFDETWNSDPTFRERWRPRPTRLQQIFSGRYLDEKLNEIADRAGIKIERQLSEHGGHWDFIGTTRYKPPKGGRSVKVRDAFEPESAAACRACVGTHDDRYRGGAGTYSVAELIISPDGELLMLERDVTGGARHLWAYYVDAIKNRRADEDERVTSPDIMDARLYQDTSSGEWTHHTGSIRVHRTRLRTGDTASWRARAPWLDGDPASGVVVVPPARPLTGDR
jgi:hypothetical protein